MYVSPTSEANLKLQVTGPDLNRVAQTFGISNLPASPYELKLDADLATGRTLINSMTVTLDTDQLVLQGELGARPELFNSSLNSLVPES